MLTQELTVEMKYRNLLLQAYLLFLISRFQTCYGDFENPETYYDTIESDEILENEILALDRFVNGHLTNKQLPPPAYNKSEFPDLGIFRQMQDNGQDKLRIFGICRTCHVGIGYMMFKVRVFKLDFVDVRRIAEFICVYFRILTPDVCNGVIERYGPAFYFIFKERPLLISKTFCGTFMQSFGCTTDDPMLDWQVIIPPSNPEITDKTERTNKTGLLKIVQLTDLHIDRLYEPGTSAVCDNKVLCCQGSQGRPFNESLQAGKFGDSRSCDTSTRSFEMVLEHIAKEHADLDLFYMNGDLVPHNVWRTSIEDNSRTIMESAETILKYFPNAKIVPLIGNHEPSPVNFFSPYGVPEDLSTTWVYNVSYEAFKQWIPPGQVDSYRRFGSYSMEINPRFRLLVINSNFCYEFNVWQIFEPNDPGGQLKWLVQELQSSEDNNQFVHIVGHVPPGHEECFHVWSRNFYEIVQRYHKIIKGQFYGHTHFDEFKVIYKDKKPISTMWIAPSLTPYNVNNLVYRVYYVNPNDYSIADHETWTFDLQKENSLVDKLLSSQVDWFRHYSLTTAYGIPDGTPESMHILVEKLAKDDQAFQLFHKHYYKSVTEHYPQHECSTFCKKRLLCGFVRRHITYYVKDDECTRVEMAIDSTPLKNVSKL